jgi:hypothetical protein
MSKVCEMKLSSLTTSSGGIVLGSSYNVDGNSASSRIGIEPVLDGRKRMLEGFKSRGGISLKIYDYCIDFDAPECTTPHMSCRYSKAFGTCLTSRKINVNSCRRWMM